MGDVAFSELDELGELEKKIDALPIFQVVILKEKLERRLEREEKKVPQGFGCLSQYANPALWEKEEEAWALAAEEKHGFH